MSLSNPVFLVRCSIADGSEPHLQGASLDRNVALYPALSKVGCLLVQVESFPHCACL